MYLKRFWFTKIINARQLVRFKHLLKSFSELCEERSITYFSSDNDTPITFGNSTSFLYGIPIFLAIDFYDLYFWAGNGKKSHIVRNISKQFPLFKDYINVFFTTNLELLTSTIYIWIISLKLKIKCVQTWFELHRYKFQQNRVISSPEQLDNSCFFCLD